MTGYVITTEIDGGACLSRSVACVSQNKLPKLSQCLQVFAWRNSLPQLALLRWPVEWICSRRRSCQRNRLPRTEQKKLFRTRTAFFCFGAVSSLESFPGPQAACSHDHLFLGCLPGPLSLGTVGAAVPLCSLGALRGRLFLGCPAGPAAWVPSGCP